MARRKAKLSGILELDMGTTQGNILLGAGASLVGEVLIPKIPLAFIQNVAGRFPGGYGLFTAAAIAGYKWWRGDRGTAMEILTGGAILAAGPLVQGFLSQFAGMGLVTATPYGMSAVVPTVEMSDGSRHALGDGEYGPPVEVMQGLGQYGVNVLQGHQQGYFYQ